MKAVGRDFLTCGAIAERFPEAVQATLDHGHVVEGHGYNHEIARYLSRDEEDQVMKKAIAMIQKRTGRRCYGWRSCTQSTNTIELLIENGFVFNQLLSPRTALPLGERGQAPGRAAAPAVGHRHSEYGNPYHVVWASLGIRLPLPDLLSERVQDGWCRRRRR
jgi:peptidoglycan-N-acetylglucosamine deacetylase